MVLSSRSVIVQARMRPEIKFAAEQVLRSFGLSMTEGMELFMRRLILDQRIPFDIPRLDDNTLEPIIEAWKAQTNRKLSPSHTRKSNSGGRKKRE